MNLFSPFGKFAKIEGLNLVISTITPEFRNGGEKTEAIFRRANLGIFYIYATFILL